MDGLHFDPAAAAIPGRKHSCQSPRARYADPVGPDRLAPLDSAQVPLGQCQRLRLDDEVWLEPRIFSADLRPVSVDEEPEPPAAPGLIGELKLDDHPMLREAIVLKVPIAPRPQHDEWVDVLGRQVQPAFPPRPKCAQEVPQILTRLGGVIQRASSGGVRCAPYDPYPLQLAETGGEEGSGEAWCAVGELSEGGASVQEVAEDDGCPSLGEDLGGSGDRAVLAVAAHVRSVAVQGTAYQSIFCTSSDSEQADGGSVR